MSWIRTLKTFAREKVPLADEVHSVILHPRHYLKRFTTQMRLRRSSPSETFTRIYHSNAWGGNESLSGPGSSLKAVSAVRLELEQLLADLEIKSVLDIPCGDFHWMQHVAMPGIRYIGGDIVAPLIDKNQQRYAQPFRQFRVIDITADELPAVDLLFCRDCLVHLSFANIRKALDNIRMSGARYMLSTTYPNKTNRDIVTGDWRPVNLQREPFGLPPPLRLINEGPTNPESTTLADKSLGLWDLSQI